MSFNFFGLAYGLCPVADADKFNLGEILFPVVVVVADSVGLLLRYMGCYSGKLVVA